MLLHYSVAHTHPHEPGCQCLSPHYDAKPHITIAPMHLAICYGKLLRANLHSTINCTAQHFSTLCFASSSCFQPSPLLHQELVLLASAQAQERCECPLPIPSPPPPCNICLLSLPSFSSMDQPPHPHTHSHLCLRSLCWFGREVNALSSSSSLLFLRATSSSPPRPFSSSPRRLTASKTGVELCFISTWFSIILSG